MTLLIRAPAAADETRWRSLWAQYVAFYRATVPEQATATTWQRMLEPEGPVFGRLAEMNGTVTGFAVCVLHAGTWSPAPLCYLEDLFVDPAHRGGGVGAALIEHLVALGRVRGWSRLYWHTEAGNETARRLYDRFTSADGYVRYRIPLA